MGIPKNSPNGKCQICAHPERGRIDYLASTGGGEWGKGLRAVAKKFEISFAALYRHAHAHISTEYRNAVKIGPFQSEEHLRKLLAESGASVLDRFNALYSGHLSRWLNALEACDDHNMLQHGRMMSVLLGRVGLITHELMPSTAHTNIQQNFYMSPDFHAFQRRAIQVLRKHPEAMQGWIEAFRPEPPAMIEHAEAAAD
jgi:hypothetical protein